MPIDPVYCWLIALGVATLYGWIMYNRGFNAGGTESSRIICLALDDAGVMKPPRLLQIVERYWEKIMSQSEEEE